MKPTNYLLSLIDREKYQQRTVNYDFALRRLCVTADDDWSSVTNISYGSDYNPEPPVFAAKFAKCFNYSHILALATEDGQIVLQNVNKGFYDSSERCLTGTQCHYNAIFDISWDPGQMKLLSASGDHTSRLWNVSDAGLSLVHIYSGHSRSVKTVTFRKNDSTVFATGGRDGAILIWDMRTRHRVGSIPRPDNFIYDAHKSVISKKPFSMSKRRKLSHLIPSTITGLAFQDDNHLISCGASDGVIKVWDIRRNYTICKNDPVPKYTITHTGHSTSKGFTNLLVNNSGTKLYASCMDNTIYCYNLASYSSNPLQKYTGLRNNTFYIKSYLSPDENYLISGSSDEFAYIWNVNKPKPLIALAGHEFEVTCVAWSDTVETSIVTCSDDARHKIWRLGPENINENDKSQYISYATYFNENTHSDDIKNETCKVVPRLYRCDKDSDNDVNNDNDIENVDGIIASMTNNRTLNYFMSSLELRQCDILSNNNNNNNNNQENVLGMSNSSCSKLSLVHPSSLSSSATVTSTNTVTSAADKQSNSISFSARPPTLDLPNYVLTGEAPHLPPVSPKRKIAINSDWLTLFGQRKLLKAKNKLDQEDSKTQAATGDIISNPSSSSLFNLESTETKNHSSSSYKKSSSTVTCTVTNQQNEQTSTLTSFANRRNNESSILRFFKVSSPSTSSRQNSTKFTKPNDNDENNLNA